MSLERAIQSSEQSERDRAFEEAALSIFADLKTGLINFSQAMIELRQAIKHHYPETAG